jgi:hypothetical protein
LSPAGPTENAAASGPVRVASETSIGSAPTLRRIAERSELLVPTTTSPKARVPSVGAMTCWASGGAMPVPLTVDTSGARNSKLAWIAQLCGPAKLGVNVTEKVAGWLSHGARRRGSVSQ